MAFVRETHEATKTQVETETTVAPYLSPYQPDSTKHHQNRYTIKIHKGTFFSKLNHVIGGWVGRYAQVSVEKKYSKQAEGWEVYQVQFLMSSRLT